MNEVTRWLTDNLTGRIIHNIRDLADYLGVPSCFEGDYERAVERAIFKYTDCGCVFAALPDRVVVSGYAEGADVECPGHELEYPFTAQRFDAALDLADEEGCELWLRWNVDPVECPRCGEIELYCVSEGDGLYEYECESCGHYETAGGWAARPLENEGVAPQNTETGEGGAAEKEGSK